MLIFKTCLFSSKYRQQQVSLSASIEDIKVNVPIIPPYVAHSVSKIEEIQAVWSAFKALYNYCGEEVLTTMGVILFLIVQRETGLNSMVQLSWVSKGFILNKNNNRRKKFKVK